MGRFFPWPLEFGRGFYLWTHSWFSWDKWILRLTCLYKEYTRYISIRCGIKITFGTSSVWKSNRSTFFWTTKDFFSTRLKWSQKSKSEPDQNSCITHCSGNNRIRQITRQANWSSEENGDWSTFAKYWQYCTDKAILYECPPHTKLGGKRDKYEYTSKRGVPICAKKSSSLRIWPFPLTFEPKNCFRT